MYVVCIYIHTYVAVDTQKICVYIYIIIICMLVNIYILHVYVCAD